MRHHVAPHAQHQHEGRCGLAHHHMVDPLWACPGRGVWVGGYALLAMVLIPAMAKQAHHTLVPAALTAIRLLASIMGSATRLP